MNKFQTESKIVFLNNQNTIAFRVKKMFWLYLLFVSGNKADSTMNTIINKQVL